MLRPKSFIRKGVLLFALFALCSNSYSQDLIPPQARCRPGLVIVLPATGTITVQATEFDDGSTDNVTLPENLKFYFNNDPLLTEYTINCDSFVKHGVFNELVIPLTFMIQDEALNRSACHVMLVIQDNKAVCGSPAIECYGCVKEWRSGDLMRALINCDEDTNYCYNVVLEQPTSVSFCRNWDPLNGVSTGDIVKIQRHLLGLDEFDHRLQWVAADINNNVSVTAADISSLRKLILGVYSDFSTWGLDSWIIKTVPDMRTGQWFDTIHFNNLDTCPEVLNFIGVKIGDLNGDVNEDFNGNKTRSTVKGDLAQVNPKSVELLMDSELGIAGLELHLDLPEDSKVSAVEIGGNKLSTNYYNQLDQKLILSWNTTDGKAFATKNEKLNIHLEFEAQIDIDELVFQRGEIYNESADVFHISLELSKYGHKDGMTVFPNPVVGNGEVLLSFPGIDAAKLELYSFSGKKMSATAVQINESEAKLQLIDIAKGIYFLTFKNSEVSHCKRLIVH
jgi:hypothetical protein